MKKVLIFLNTFVILFAFSSCEEWLDVNKDPDNPTTATVELVLPAAQASVAVTMSGNNLFNLGGFLAQYWDQNPTANQYNLQSTYSFQTDDYNTVWDELYAGALNDIEFVRKSALADEDWGNYLVATTLRAYVFQYLVDLHDKIPFTEALQGTDKVTPIFDDGEFVYEAILDELDEALAKPLTSATISSSDLFLESNLNDWIAFARTLKLKILLRMAYTSDPHTAEITTLLNDGIFLTKNVGIRGTYYANEQNKRNPWFETNTSRLSGDGPFSINHVACENFMTYLLLKGDPRVSALFFPAASDGNHNGNYFGSSKIATERKANTQAAFSTINIPFNHPSFIMLASESFLLQAEAQARAGNYTDAKLLYNAGVASSFDLAGVSANPADFTGTGDPYEFTATDLDQAIEQIMMQKWVCLAHYNNIEAWIEQTRTGIPKISPVLYADEDGYVPGDWTSPVDNRLGNGRFPKRMYWPETEVSSNPNTPTQIADMAAVGVWWDQND